MPFTTQTTDFWGWYNRHNTRFEYSHFEKAGINQFLIGPNQNPDDFLQLVNVLPSITGAFQRRWGTVQIAAFDTTAHPINPVRWFPYNAFQDQSAPSTTTTRNLWVFTDDSSFFVRQDDGTAYTGFAPAVPSTTFPVVAPNYIGAVSSRNFFYYGQGNGLWLPQKIDMTQTTTNLQSNMGISPEPDGSVSFTAVGYAAYGLSSWTPTVTVTGGGGTGATVGVNYLTTTVNGVSYNFVESLTVTAPGSNYTSSPTVTWSGGGIGVPPLLAYVDLNSNNTTKGQLVAVLPGGPMQFAAGREYTGAYQNSLTGHTSDIVYSNLFTTQPAPLPPSSQPYVWAALSQGAEPGWEVILANINLGTTTLADLDPQVDHFLLLATSDGGSLETLYEDDIIPIGSFAINGGYGPDLTYQFIDTVPDSYTEIYQTGPTLLDANLWVQPAATALGTIGIAGNTAPVPNFYYPTAHQGRIFATDGKTVFYSKSIDEITTSTGLITAKWEECWPGTYQLPIALNNDVIVSMKSDGQVLHVGTTKALYAIYGTDATNFSVPGLQFSQTGILNNDLFTSVYSQGQPAGFMWVTPDFKIMWSDFNTYEDVGTQIYPLIEGWVTAFSETAKMSAMTYGPFNFVFLTFQNANGTQFLVFETSLRRWYLWNVAPIGSGAAGQALLSFVYQSPTTGSRNLYFTQGTTSTRPPTSWPNGFTWSILQFSPAATSDALSGFIDWTIQTCFQPLGDSFAFKVLNEMEILSDDIVADVADYQLTIFGANSQQDFESPFSIGPFLPVLSPLQNTYKIYLAGQTTVARFYSFQLGSRPATSSTTQNVLTSFQVEAYPMARI